MELVELQKAEEVSFPQAVAFEVSLLMVDSEGLPVPVPDRQDQLDFEGSTVGILQGWCIFLQKERAPFLQAALYPLLQLVAFAVAFAGLLQDS